MSRLLRCAALCVLSIALVLLGTGCATYSDRLLNARTAVAAGEFETGVEEMNSALGVSSHEDLPDQWKDDRGLAALERGVLQQAVGRYPDSARDLSAADQELELLDLTPAAIGDIGSYVYSDSSKVYRVPPVERLALNAVNMLNYLAQYDLAGASVEARRFTVMREYLESMEDVPDASFGSYLAGFTFEYLGDGNRALRYYEEALQTGQFTTLGAPVSRLAARNPHRGPGIEELLGSHAGGSDHPLGKSSGEILIVISLGRVPYKIPERIAVGAAVGIAGELVTDDANILEYSLLKTLVYPELTESNSVARVGEVRIDGEAVPVELLTDHSAEVRKEFESIKPRIIGSALTRLIVRAGVAEAARAAGNQADSGGVLGLIAALVTEGTMLAFDRPDTRSWSFLADRIHVARRRVEPGEHEVVVAVAGVAEEGGPIRVSVPEGGYAIIVVTDPR
jgi:hypothetical protein